VDGATAPAELATTVAGVLEIREQTLTGATPTLEAESRLHLVEGLLTALSELDEVISFCGRRVMAVRQKLQSRFNLSEEQSDACATATPYRFGTAELAAGGGPTKSTN